jgi:hypothetical protein
MSKHEQLQKQQNLPQNQEADSPLEMPERGLKFGATNPKQLEILLSQKEQEVERLKKTAPMILAQLETLVRQRSADTEIFYFTGPAGLKHITINSLQAKDYLYIYEMHQDMSTFADAEFSEDIRRSLVDNRIMTHQLTNLKKTVPYTKVTELVEHFWEIRHIDPKELSIDL